MIPPRHPHPTAGSVDHLLGGPPGLRNAMPPTALFNHASMKSNAKISVRLLIGFGVTVVLGMGIAILGTLTMTTLSADVNELAGNGMATVAQLGELQDNFNSIARYARNIVISDDGSFRDRQVKLIADKRLRNGELMAALQRSITSPNGIETLRSIDAMGKPYNLAMDHVIEAALSGDKGGAGALLIGEGVALQNVLFKAVDDSRHSQQTVADALAQDARETTSRGRTLMAAFILLMASLGSFAGWTTTRHIKTSLGAEPEELNALVKRIADGDLSLANAVPPSDTTSVLANLARMQLKLNRVVRAVRSGADSVAVASAQIALGNMDLSHRTEEQASSLEETAASMEQLNATASQTADNARQASQLATLATDVALKGSVVVGKVVETMNSIDDASRRIAEITGVIDGIAFQTNILALNAAVEAARAGDHGRGFGVVASEVRSLARRAADAAKEINALITNSVACARQGSGLVDETGLTMNEIVASIRRVSDLMGEIDMASCEQSTGVREVGEAIAQMDQVTQQNAALVQESAAAAESLKSQAQQLVQAVAAFTLEVDAVACEETERAKRTALWSFSTKSAAQDQAPTICATVSAHPKVSSGASRQATGESFEFAALNSSQVGDSRFELR